MYIVTIQNSGQDFKYRKNEKQKNGRLVNKMKQKGIGMLASKKKDYVQD